MHEIHPKLLQELNSNIEPIEISQPYTSLLNKIGDARFVLIGEATHGTKEFYEMRAEITLELIKQKGFMAVAIEGDWPDCHRIHRYLNGALSKNDVLDALSEFKRFPIWMWRNKTIVSFLKSLREYNDNLQTNKIGFYGLDLYSLHSSMNAVINYLNKVDPEAAIRAKQRYACFDHLSLDPQQYGYLTTSGIKKSCIKEAVQELLELQNQCFNYSKDSSIHAEEEYFFAVQNARVVKDAENYYRSMFEGRVSSWNLRDTHMVETLNVISDYLETRFNKPAKIVVWAHNSHLGDARATEMGSSGEINIGQLVREQHFMDTYAIGFSTYSGYVTAADNWDDIAERKEVKPGMIGSYEELFHQLDHKNFLLDLKKSQALTHYLEIPRLQRAIGVIYRPETERYSHYFFTRLPYQFDCMIHLDRTSAVEPLD